MDYSRIRDFVMSYSHDDTGLLKDIHDKALEKDVPIIRREAADYLKVMLQIVRPKNVLEIGTAVAYSTLLIADTLADVFGKNGTLMYDAESTWSIDTCELDTDRITEARTNIAKSGYKNIQIFEGDAAETLRGIQDKVYDFIFIDAAKAQYMIYMEEAIRLSHPGTVIITDNILADGDVLESHFLVEKRDRTIHDRMREYLYMIKNDDRLETAILSVADGIAVSVVKKN